MRIGVDVGGTFTDFVVHDEGAGSFTTFKLLSTPAAPEKAVLEGLRSIPGADMASISHGTTVGTNAVLERRGARVAFVTTAGFRDLLQIGRQNRSSLYDFQADRPIPLIPPERSFEVRERIDRAGRVILPLAATEVERVVADVLASGSESAAVCLLFSFLEPAHEAQLAAGLRRAGLSVSISSEVLPEFREYERASATALDAFLAPRLGDYLRRLEAALPTASLRIMQSNGGSAQAALARQRAVRSVLSGPAAGVIGAQFVARAAGFSVVITLDMGGTSTDVSLLRGQPALTTSALIDGLPIGVPAIDLHTVGAGGGSVATVDAGGALRVGPQSAGADPGPAAYGRGGLLPTVTDADVILGWLPPETFTAGGLRLDIAASEAAFQDLAGRAGMAIPPGLSPAEAAARGVVQVVQARMARALRVISLERGHDPADFVLVAFGGAAGLHACALAREVGIRRVLVPAAASVLSALGMLTADVVLDLGRSVLLRGDTPLAKLEQGFRPMEDQVQADFKAEGVPEPQISLLRSLDLQYEGQSFALNVPLGPAFRLEFDSLHQMTYGYADPSWPVEIVNLRLHAVGSREPIQLPSAKEAEGTHPSPVGRTKVVLGESRGEVPFYLPPLAPGAQILGPAILGLHDTTVVLSEFDRASVDRFANLHIEVG